MRLDKYISKATLMSRTESQNAIKKGRIAVDEVIAKVPDMKINEKINKVTFDGKLLEYSEYIYIMMNKPAGVLSATEDGKGQTVIDLLPDVYMNTGIFPVGRLDKDTVGLLLITNNGPLAHKMLSPKKHVDKTYYLKSEKAISEEDRLKIEEGVFIGDGITTMPAKFELDSDKMGGFLTIREGKFHQIKRMLEAVNNKVCFLERVKFGTLLLDNSLERGSWRKLEKNEEMELIKNYQ